MLEKAKSLCKPDAKIIISQDKKTGNQVYHRALNPEKKFVRQYKLDAIIKTKECCDFVVLNDDLQSSYLIELKGSDVKKAINQLNNARGLLQKELKSYHFFFRCIYRHSSHEVRSSQVVNLMRKSGKIQGKRVWEFKQGKYEENIFII